MEVLHTRCAGLDVHKDSIVACIRHTDRKEEIRTFGTTTSQILALGDWLAQEGVSIVAMESTGVFWKPIWNLLEGRFELMLVNAQHIKQVPGRKTDVKDCQWIAQLLQHGLLRPSFVPARPQRELRDLTRQRTQLIGDRARVVNRIQKVLEDANIKLASVATDILGKSGRAMLEALIEGQLEPTALAELARQRMRSKIPQLREALSGGVREHHRFLLRSLLTQVDGLDQLIACFDARIEQVMSPLERELLKQLDEVPGIDTRSAQSILAEIGTDMGRFPSAKHLASWAGLCPGNHESAGKRYSGRTRLANPWLKRTLSQCAWAASRTRHSYFHAQFGRLSKRRGRKRAIVALAHSLLGVIYHLIGEAGSYVDLGADLFQKLEPERRARSLVARLEQLGYKGVLEREVA